jgi:hypothetical protein
LAVAKGGLEEDFGGTEALVADGDGVAIGKLVGLVDSGGLGSGLHLLIEVEGNVAELLLDVTGDFTPSSGGERAVAALGR